MKATKRSLVGRKIVAVDWRKFGTGRPDLKTATDPVLYLDNGRAIRFVVIETEVGEYGVAIVIEDGAQPI